MEQRRRHRDFKDYRLREDIDDPNVLRDGERMRVPMMMADSGDAADGHVLLDDHQPGHYRPKDQAALDAKEQAYRERARDDEIAWRSPPLYTPPPTPPSATTGALPFAARPFHAARLGDICTVHGGADEGASGHLVEDGHGALVCVPDRRRTDAMPRADDHHLMDDRFIENDRAETARAYAAYDAEQADAWRNR
jgi:hypothetical protein